jgi:Protein of unknown function (DUF3667)
MSHLRERKEKNCLNCETTVIGKYCHACGQENAEPKETVWQLVSHFFSDMTHFDGKVFTSMKDLILKPGFLSAEYMRGKRASYLNPIRMYLFTSFVFFLIFFSLFKVDENKLNGSRAAISNKIDSATLKEVAKQLHNGKITTTGELRKVIEDTASGIVFKTNFQSRAQFDSLMQSGKTRPNWFKRQLANKVFAIEDKYSHNSGMLVTNFTNAFLHSIPQMLFILLPMFALYLKFLYKRHRDYYYADHAIFTIHFYIFVFIDMLFVFSFSKLTHISWLSWLSYLNILLVFAIFFYMYKAMRNFYNQRRAKTIVKFLLLNFSFFLTAVFLLIIFVFLSLYQV